MKHNKWFSILMLVLLASLLTPITARADVAPPEQPPGASIVPGSENTQVRMVAETVTLKVLPKPSANQLAQAATVADFTMRNLGSETETMQARFPLTFWNDRDDGFGKFPEISDIQIFVDGKQVSTHRIDANFSNSGGIAYQQAPWAAFDVSFPPATDVNITVKYTTNGYGYADGPNAVFRYILETGAGWNGTIGSADVIIKLPYPATGENVTDSDLSFGITPGMQLVENTARWHFEDFEPTSENNISVDLVIPTFWQRVLDGRAQTQKTPNDGEAWGQLGKAIKEAIRAAKGYPREDAAAQKIYAEAADAYEKAVTLLPKDALWHYGFADLVWSHYYFSNDWHTTFGEMEMFQVVDQLRQSLALDPDNVQAKALADWIAEFDAPYIRKKGNGYDFLALTATLTVSPATETPLPEASSTPQAAPTLTAAPAAATDVPASPTKSPQPGLPLCGGAALILPALAGLWWLLSRRQA